MMTMEPQHHGPLAMIASLLTPPQTAARSTRPAPGEPAAADATWDEMVRWFAEQREWAELVATYADLDPAGTR